MKPHARSTKRVLGVFCAAMFAAHASRLPASQIPITTLHHFLSSEGNSPNGTLALSGSILYDTTYLSNSGSQGGTVFRINTDGSAFQTLRTFSTASSGAYRPEGTLTLAGSTMYGTTTRGGGADQGTIFKMNLDGTGYSVLHAFAASAPFPGGAQPEGGLLISGSTLYGTTTFSDFGVTGGSTFKMNTDGSGFSLLHNFTTGGAAGYIPGRDLTLAGGKLYGTTNTGGTNGNGSVFSMNLDGTGFTVLHSFAASGGEGTSAHGGLVVSSSTIYGTTLNATTTNGGIIFSMQTDGTAFSVLHTFLKTGGDGYNPESEMLLSGSTLYGTTEFGGSSDNGTIFQINSHGSGYQTLHSFDAFASEGSRPWGGLTLVGANLFGTTRAGGSSGFGTVFSMAVPEPATICLALSGIILLATASSRSRQRATHPASK